MRIHPNKTVGTRVLVAMAVVGLVLTASACGSGKQTTTTTASAATMQWAGDVCTAFTTWKTALNNTKSTLTGGGAPTDAELTQAGQQVHDATTTLVASLKSLGPPQAADTEKAKNNLTDLETSITFSMNKIKDTVEQHPTTAADLATELTTVKQAIATMAASLGTAVTNLKALDASGEIEQAFNDAPSCATYF